VHSTQLEGRQVRPGAARLFKRVLAEHNTDGLLVFTNSLDDAELRRLEALGFPTVLMHRTTPEGLHIPAVNIDNHCGVAALMAHLVEAHHYRRIAHLRGEAGHEDSIQRELGYRRALESFSIPYDPALVETGAFNAEQARLAVRRLLSRGARFQAIFAADDESASGAMMELREAGLRVPEDIAVVGFDDLSLAEHLSPTLTTVHSPIEEAAYTAARLLLAAIAGRSQPQPPLLPTSLVIRHSCGCPLTNFLTPERDEKERK
jgi:LacI family transcriptional regulator